MVTLLTIIGRLIEDALQWLELLLRSTESIEAENVFLRRQLALNIEFASRLKQRHVLPVARQMLAFVEREG